MLYMYTSRRVALPPVRRSRCFGPPQPFSDQGDKDVRGTTSRQPFHHAVGTVGVRHIGQVPASPLPIQESMQAAWNACEQLHNSVTSCPPTSSAAKQIAQMPTHPSSSSAPSTSAGATRGRLYCGAVHEDERFTFGGELGCQNAASMRRSIGAVSTSSLQGSPGSISPSNETMPRRSRTTAATKRT